MSLENKQPSPGEARRIYTTEEDKDFIEELKQWRITRDNAIAKGLTPLPRPSNKKSISQSVSSSVAPETSIEPYSILKDTKKIDELLLRAQNRVSSITPSLKDFGAIYSPEVIKNNLAYIEEKEELFARGSEEEKHTKKLAIILEAILADGLVRYEWLGKTVRLYPPSKYDEIHHGIDGVLEIDQENGNSFLALGVDVTFGTSDAVLQKKFRNLTENIRNGSLAEVKYFLNEKEEPMQGFKAPKIILAIPINEVEELMTLWGDKNHNQLKVHRIRSRLVSESLVQCKELAAYARKHKQEHIAQSYEEIIEKIESIVLSGPAYLKAALADENEQTLQKMTTIIRTIDTQPKPVKKIVTARKVA